MEVGGTGRAEHLGSLIPKADQSIGRRALLASQLSLNIQCLGGARGINIWLHDM